VKERRWVGDQTLAKFTLSHGEYFFVDDRGGGRRAATHLEIVLWKRLFGRVPVGPDANHPTPKRRTTQAKSTEEP